MATIMDPISSWSLSAEGTFTIFVNFGALYLVR